jgi:hypothetical protein
MGRRKNTVLVFAVHIGLALGLGIAYYALFRPEARVTLWLARILRQPMLGRAALPDTWLTRLIHWHLADFLWAYALTFSLYLVRLLFGSAARWTFPACLTGAVVMELLQLLGFAGGTFDIWDIAAQVLATLAARLLIHLITREKGATHHVSEPEQPAVS